jgi:hypothetical protein
LGLAELRARVSDARQPPLQLRPVPPPIAGGNREHEGAKRMPHLDRIQSVDSTSGAGVLSTTAAPGP